jgi:hypothetical protein
MPDDVTGELIGFEMLLLGVSLDHFLDGSPMPFVLPSEPAPSGMRFAKLVDQV